MRLTTRPGRLAGLDTPLLVVPWSQLATDSGGRAVPLAPNLAELNAVLGGALRRVVSNGDFSARKGEQLVLYRSESDGPQRVLLLGAGKADEISTVRLRQVGGFAARGARELGITKLSLNVGVIGGRTLTGAEDAQALAEGLVLGAWRFEELKAPEPEASQPLEAAELVSEDESITGTASAGIRQALAVAGGQNLARELASRPANIATPRYLGEQAEEIARERGLKASVLGPKQLEKEKMGALLAVARGSAEEPRLITLEHRGASGGGGGGGGDSPLVLVGKGVTFDSGGLSLKPAAGMETMKYDMSGAAAVLGAMRAIGELAPAVNVVGVIPAVENMPSADAMRPGDVITAHSGKTIEVLNTDAEGRLILADALSYSARFEPAAMVDAATLTGACVIALGSQAMGLMGNDRGVIEQLKSAAERSGERVWELPMYEEYREQLKSDIADIQNTGGRPAGTITAGMFLRDFVGTIPWAHLDIAGTAWAEEAGPFQPKGPTGVGVRLFTEWVLGQAR